MKWFSDYFSNTSVCLFSLHAEIHRYLILAFLPLFTIQDQLTQISKNVLASLVSKQCCFFQIELFADLRLFNAEIPGQDPCQLRQDV